MNRMGHIDYPTYQTPPRPAPDAGEGFDLRDVVQLVWSARWPIIFFMLVGAAIAYIMVKQITPQYRAEASIMLDIRDQNVINLESVLSDTPLNRELLESELLVLESDVLLAQVVDKLRLDLDPEYNPALRRPSEMQMMIAETRAEIVEALGIGELLGEDPAAVDAATAAPVAPEEQDAETRRDAIRALRGKLRTRQLSPAYAIEVQIVSADPVKAALIANTIADQYVADQLEAKVDAARRATTWLTGRLEELRARAETSAAKVQAYTNANQTGDSQAVAITQQQIAQLSASLINARAEAAQAQAKLDQTRRMVDDLGLAQAAVAMTSPLIVSLRGQRAELTRRQAELANRYGSKHPSMVEVRSQIADVDRAISGEVTQIMNGLEGDVRVAEARVSAMSEGLAELEGRASGQSEASVGLAQLQAEASADRKLYENFLARLNETREQEGFQTADSRVIEPASPPYAPFMPRSKVTTALGGIAGGALGFALVVFFRLMDRSVRSPGAVSARTGLAVLASIPRMSRRHVGKRLLRYIARRPNSELAEAARYFRNAVVMRDSDVKSVLITSALPEEGKMTLALLLSEMTARADKSVLLIDADFRRPKIGTTLAMKPEHDLVSALTGACRIEEAIHRPDGAAFDVIPLKVGQADRSDLLALPRMKAMVALLGERYDLVVIEGPPILGVGDFSVLGRIVDTAVLGVEWSRTSLAAVERATQWLAEHHVHVLGAVLNKVDNRRAANYDPAAHGGDYAAIQKYYLN